MTSYGDALAANIRAVRAHRNVSQEDLSQRMRWLGFNGWIRQTIGSVEHGDRTVRADEVFALALALETTVVRLMTPVDISEVQFGRIALTPAEAAEAISGGPDWPRQIVNRPTSGQPELDGSR